MPLHMDKPSPELRAVLMASISPLLEEREGLLARIGQAIERIGYIDQKVLAAATMLDESPPVLTPILDLVSHAKTEGGVGQNQPSDPAPESWRDFILAVLKGTDRGYTNAALMERAVKMGFGKFADRYRNSPNGYFAAARLLEAEKKIVRSGRATYLADVFRRIEAGELVEAEQAQDASQPGGAAAVIIAAITDGGPMTPKELIGRFKNSPETAALANERINTVYAVLSKLVKRDMLIRGGEGKYRLPSQKAPEVASAPSEQRGDLFPSQDTGGAKMVN